VQDFQFYVTDDRYAVASMMLVQTKDMASARVLALNLLKDPHHRALEVWQDERWQFSLGDPSPARSVSPAALGPSPAPP
jgi:hypothetical protein